MNRYPHLPTALHTLLEAGPWEGTPTGLWEALETETGTLLLPLSIEVADL